MGLAFNGNEIRSLNTTNGLHSGGKENKVGGGRLQGEEVSGRKEGTVGRTQGKGDNGKLSLTLPALESPAIVSHPCEPPPPEGRQAQPKPQPTSQPVVKPRGWDFNRTGELNPVCCVRHPLPVQALKVHGGEGGTSGLLLVCCGEENSDHLQVLVYQLLLTGDSCRLVSSLALRAAGEEGEAIHFEVRRSWGQTSSAGNSKYKYIHIHICVYIYTCMCIYIHICVYIYTYVCIYRHIGVYIYIHVYVYIYVYIYTYMCIYIHMFVYIYTFMCTYLCTYVCTYIHICVHIYVFVCTYIHICVYIYVHIYVYQNGSRLGYGQASGCELQGG